MTQRSPFITLLIVSVFYVNVSANCPSVHPLTWSHTSASTATGTVTSKSVYSGSYPAWLAFQDSSSSWISAVYDSPTWIAYAFTRTRTIRSYRLLFKNGSLNSRAPMRFDLQVKQGYTWKTIDSRCCEIDWAGSEERTYVLGLAASGQEFRFMFYDDNDSRSGIVVISLARIQFLGS